MIKTGLEKGSSKIWTRVFEFRFQVASIYTIEVARI